MTASDTGYEDTGYEIHLSGDDALWLPTYRRVQADARMLSSDQLSWVTTRATRRAQSGDVHDRVTLLALLGELRCRGEETPEHGRR